MIARVGSWINSARRHALATVVALAGASFLIGAAVSFKSGSTLDYSDEHDYVNLARHLADGLGFSANGKTPTAFRPPAWPAVISAVDFVGGGITLTRLVNVGFFSLSVIALYALVRRIAGSDAGLLAAAALAVYPLSLYTSTKLFPASLALLLVTVGLLAIVAANDTEVPMTRVLWAAAAGACFGLVGLTEAAYLVIGVVAFVWSLWRRVSLQRVMTIALPLALVTIIPLAAWGIRNESQLGSFVPVSTNGGLNLLLGNSPNATPTSGVDANITTNLNEAKRRGLDEAETDRYFREQAIDWIKHNPGRASSLYVRKLANFFNYRSNVVTRDQQSRVTDLLGAITFYPLLALFALRLAAFRKIPLVRGEGLLVTSYLLYAMTAALFFTRIRFRVPVDQLMIGVIACGVIAWTRARAPRPAAAPAG